MPISEEDIEFNFENDSSDGGEPIDTNDYAKEESDEEDFFSVLRKRGKNRRHVVESESEGEEDSEEEVDYRYLYKQAMKGKVSEKQPKQLKTLLKKDNPHPKRTYEYYDWDYDNIKKGDPNKKWSRDRHQKAQGRLGSKPKAAKVVPKTVPKEIVEVSKPKAAVKSTGRRGKTDLTRFNF